MSNPQHRLLQVQAIVIALLCSDAWSDVPATDMTTTSVAVSIGLTPESLTVAGFDEADVEPTLQRLETEAELRESWAAQATIVDELLASAASLAEQFQDNPTDTTYINQIATNAEQLATAQTSLESYRTQLLEAALDGVAQEQVDLLAIWQANAGYHVPAEFRALQRTPEQWKEIEIALRVEARAIRLDEAVDPDVAELLEACRDDQSVIEAMQQLATELDGISTQYDQFAATDDLD